MTLDQQNFCITTAQFNTAKFRIALLVPMSGSSGLWGPSAIASAQTAAHEINAHKGIFNCEVILVCFDAAMEAINVLLPKLETQLREKKIDAIIGMHISSVYQKIVRLVAGRVLYIYTPSYEDRQKHSGIYSIGEPLQHQIKPAIEAITEKYKVKRWALIGNNHGWPRSSHYYAHKTINGLGGKIVLEQFVQSSLKLKQNIFAHLKSCQADAVLISLLGQDAINFNRKFGALDLHRSMVRLSGVIEENCLLAIGEKNTQRLYSVAGYFHSLDTDANIAFKENYIKMHQSRAPMLNTLGQSLYEGIHFLTALIEDAQIHDGIIRNSQSSLSYQSVRNGIYSQNAVTMPIYLAKADGIVFNVEKTLTQ